MARTAGPALDTSAAAQTFTLILAAAVFIALRVPCATIPLERDEGEYAYTAQQMLAGRTPYLDVFDQKPPGIFLAYLIPVSLFGTSVAAIHLTAYVWSAAAAIFIYATARRLLDRHSAGFATLIFAYLTIEPFWLATAANTEQFVMLPMAISAWCALRSRGSDRRLVWIAAAGAAALATCWFKQIAATNLLFITWLVLRRPASDTTRRTPLLRRLGVLLAGIGAIAAPIMLWFWHRGAWSAFVDAVWSHNTAYAAQTSWADGLRYLGEELSAQAHSLWLIWVLALLGLFFLRTPNRQATAFLAVWLACCAVGVCVGHRFFPHYFLYLAPPLAISAGRSMSWIVNVASPRGDGRRRVIASAAACTASLAPPLIYHGPFFFASTATEKSIMMYDKGPFSVSPEIAQYLTQHTRPTDRILIYGSEPQILFLAQRTSATRYIIFHPLLMPAPDTFARQQEAWDEIRRAAPPYIVMTELDGPLLSEPGAPSTLRENVTAILRDDYELDGLRLFRDRHPRMLFGDAARAHSHRVSESGRHDDMDMFLMRRRRWP